MSSNTTMSSKLTSKIFPTLNAMIFVAGAVTLQACFFGGHPAHGPDPYAYGPGPAYMYDGPRLTHTSDRRSWVTTTTITRGMIAIGGFKTTIPGCSSIIRNGSRTSMVMRAITHLGKLPLADSRARD